MMHTARGTYAGRNTPVDRVAPGLVAMPLTVKITANEALKHPGFAPTSVSRGSPASREEAILRATQGSD